MNDAVAPPREQQAADEFNLREIIAILRDHWVWIAVFTVLGALMSLAYALIATPVYRTNALIQVEEKGGGMSGLGELSSVLAGDAPTEAEIEIVRSRAVLGAAVQQQKLDMEVLPVYFPLIGATLARSHSGDKLADPLLGLDGYAWGGEQIQIDRFEVPRALRGVALELQAGAGGTYSLAYEGEILLSGQVGEAASGRGVSMFVSQLVAHPGTRFHVVRRGWLSALQRLGSRLTVEERGKQTGILELTLDGPSPKRIAETLSAISSIYLRQNVERTSEDAAKTLEFLDEQLPELKLQLDAAEAALNQYRVSLGTVDLSLETQGLLEKIGDVERQLSEIELRQAELAQKFTAEHPVMAALAQQRTELEQGRSSMEVQIRQLPEAEQDSLRLMRDVRVANELYMLLLNRAQELKVVRAGTVGNVRIIDDAFVPFRPIKPRRSMILALGIVAGGLVGVLIVFLREAMNQAIRDPEELEKIGGLPVYAIVPHSEHESALNTKMKKEGAAGRLLVGAHSEDVAIESLRSLRTSLEFLLMDVDPKIITVGGPAPGAGKSFVTANLAALFQQAGKKALLIDGDLRKGHLQRLFDVKREPGLVEVITGECEIDEAIHNDVADGLDFLSTGAMPPNPSELIISPRFQKILETLSQRYDVVLMDAPPVLGAAESVTLARLAAINLLVVRSEQQTPREVELTLNKLRQAGAQPNGFVLNDLHVRARHSYGGYHYYRYHKSS